MNTLRQELNGLFSQALQTAGYAGKYGTVKVHPLFADLDYRYDGVLKTAKLYGYSPNTITTQIIDVFGEQSRFSKLTLENTGFINIRLADSYLADYVRAMMMDKHFGCPPRLSPRLILIKYGLSDRAKTSLFKTTNFDEPQLKVCPESLSQFDLNINPIFNDTLYPLQNAEIYDLVHPIDIFALDYAEKTPSLFNDKFFDFENLYSSQNRTVPYLLYTVLHIRLLLRKANRQLFDVEKLLVPQNHAERRLLLQLTELPENVLLAYQKRTPNILVAYAHRLAFQYTRFYAESRILSQRDKAQQASWLQLANFCLRVLEYTLFLLGIDIPEQIK